MKSIIIFGAGGNTKVIIDIIKGYYNIIGISVRILQLYKV
jgi:hypothetical protein